MLRLARVARLNAVDDINARLRVLQPKIAGMM